jgi:hypothetical protein
LATKLDEVLERIKVILRNPNTPLQLKDVENLFKWRVVSDTSRTAIDMFFSKALLQIYKMLHEQQIVDDIDIDIDIQNKDLDPSKIEAISMFILLMWIYPHKSAILELWPELWP